MVVVVAVAAAIVVVVIIDIVNFYLTPGIQIRLATLGNVSEMVHRKVFQTSFRPVSDLFWTCHWAISA